MGKATESIQYKGKNWKLRYYYINNATEIKVNYTGIINDLRLHPLGSTMVTYNYDYKDNMIRSGDANNRYTVHKYDYKNNEILVQGQFSGQAVELSQREISYNGPIVGSVLETNFSVKSAKTFNSEGQLVQSAKMVNDNVYELDLIEYDGTGQIKQTLAPYRINTTDPRGHILNKRANRADVLSFYTDNTKNPNMDTNPYYYAIPKYDVLSGAVVEQGGIGSFYQPYQSDIAKSGHTTKVQNKASTRRGQYPINYWKVENNVLIPVPNFKDEVISLEIAKGPNWKSGKVNTVEVYKDWQGNLLLKKEFLSNSDSIVTCYLYDRMNRLTHIIPTAVPYVNTSRTSDTFKRFVYNYEYDNYGRQISKKLPDQGVMYMVYNKSNQLVAVQDSVQRQSNNWLFTKYDQFGRVITNILASYTGSRAQLQDIYNNATYHWEEKIGYNNSAYTSRTYPTSGGTILSINYYDYYGNNLPADCPWKLAENNETKVAMGSITASKVNILGTSKYIWTTAFYDVLGRNIRTKKSNVLDGNDEVKLSYAINSNKLYSKISKHQVGQNIIDSRKDNFYSNLVLTGSSYSANINGKSISAQFGNEYDINGRLSATRIGGISATGYVVKVSLKYDFLGRVKDLTGVYPNNTQVFKINYGFEDVANNEFRGNVTQSSYSIRNNSNVNVFYTGNYTYDPLNRLVHAGNSFGAVNDKAFKEYFRYDKMGNITALSRYAKISGVTHQIDSLRYTYEGLRHNRIDDISTSSAAIKALGFNEINAIQQANEYTYDGNGRAIKDLNRGINFIRYNVLDLPDSISFSNGNWVKYVYAADGSRLSKHARINGQTLDSYYANGIEYTGTNGGAKTMQMYHGDGARIRPAGANYEFLYDITDSRGNSLATIAHNTGTNVKTVTQINSYYAYGNMAPFTEGNFVSGTKNNYLYNGKELDEETGWYDYHARLYDATIGRWNVVDPMSESFAGLSPYNYVLNNPINLTNPTGMYPQGSALIEGSGFGTPEWEMRNGITHGDKLNAQFEYQRQLNVQYGLIQADIIWNNYQKGLSSMFSMKGNGDIDMLAWVLLNPTANGAKEVLAAFNSWGGGNKQKNGYSDFFSSKEDYNS